MRLLRAAERYVVDQPGIRSWHCFSAGGFYDPENLAFGPLLGVDEHLVDPGAGFDDHAHRGVDIVSVVLSGTLLHAGGDGERIVAAGQTLVQQAGGGIRHTERNASGIDPLCFVQLISLPDATAVEVLTAGRRFDEPWLHLFVAAGSWRVGGVTLAAGDSVRATDEPLEVDGSGALVVVRRS